MASPRVETQVLALEGKEGKIIPHIFSEDKRFLWSQSGSPLYAKTAFSKTLFLEGIWFNDPLGTSAMTA